MKRSCLALLPILAVASCGLDQAAKTSPPTQFLTSTGVDTEHRFARLPFEHSWRAPDIALTDYKYLVVRPVSTKFLREDRWEDSKSSAIPDLAAYRKETKDLAKHFTKQLNIAFTDPICLFYKTTNTSRPKTAILEIALTDVHYPNPELGPPLDIPVCGFEARVTDAQTGKLIVTAADRRGPDLHISGDETHFTDNKEICSIWARQLMEATNKEIFASVRRRVIAIEDH